MNKTCIMAVCAAVAAAAEAKTSVEFYSPEIVRVVKSADGTAPAKLADIVTLAPEKGAAERAAFKVEVDEGGVVTFKTLDGRVLLREKGPEEIVPVKYAKTETFTAKQTFVLKDGESVYGLGDLENLKLDQRGTRRARLMPGNVGDGVPYLASAEGWSIYWDNTSPVWFDDTADGMSLKSEVGDAVDYYFMYGGSGDGCVKLMRKLTGEVPMVPKWAFGFWQSKERYKSQEETVEVMKRYRREGIPLDGVVQDWQYWGSNPFWNAMEFTGETFGNPRWMIDTIHKEHGRLLITIWQSFGPMTKGYRDMDAKGYLLPWGTWPASAIGHVWPPRKDYPSGVKLYDCYNAEARDIYFDNLRRLVDLGIDGWWMDSTDPDIYLDNDEDWERRNSLGQTMRSVRDAFPFYCTKGVYEHLRATTDKKRSFILTRGACAGQQRFGTTVWSGDVQSTWDMLRKQIPGGLNYSLTGNPYFNCDLGGFFAGRYGHGERGAKNDCYRELYTRWMQFGAFMPMMRSHGTDVPREVWLYGEKGDPIREALEGAIRMHYRLVPYIYSTAWQVTKNGESFMRPLWFDFPADERARKDVGTYMFGRSLLVSPVTKGLYTGESNKVEGKTDDGWNRGGSTAAAAMGVDFTAKKPWETYLPKGAVWWDMETETRHEGGATAVKETTIASMPVYVRGGSIVPYSRPLQWTDEKPQDDMSVVVYPGADAAFTLYEDEGDGYQYEKGVFTEIDFKWDDAAKTLVIGARKGAYPGMCEKRVFRVRLAGGAGREVAYAGEEVKVDLTSVGQSKQ